MALFDKQKNDPTLREVDQAFENIKRFKDQLDIEQHKLSTGTGDGWLSVHQDVVSHLYPRGLGIHPQTKKPCTDFFYHGIHCYLEGTREAIEAQAAVDSYQMLNDPQPGKSELKQ